MSLQDNYEKVIIGVGVGLAVVAGAFAYMQNSSLADKYVPTTSVPDKNTPMKGIEETTALIEFITADHAIHRPAIGKQHFDIFVGPNLVNRKGETTAIDIYNSAPIHGDIPNTWFLENGLFEDFVMSNALELDNDNDGFTNLEEYQAGTLPNSASSIPDLSSKLSLADIKLTGYSLAYSSEADPIEFRAELNGNVLWKKEIKVGDVFGEKPDVDRFELTKIEPRVIKESETKVAFVTDLKSGKNEQVYEIPYGKRNAQMIIDKSATLNISAGSKPGDFRVEEGKSFTIPGDASKTTFLVQSIDNKGKTITIKPTKGEKAMTLPLKK